MPVLDAAESRTEEIRRAIVAAVSELQSELHAKARDADDPAVGLRWAQVSLDVTVAYLALGAAVEKATDALMVDEAPRAVWERV